MNNFCELSIVGKREKENTHNNISYIGNGFNHEELIKIYDEHNIVILPSFTEAHPKVGDEALSRLRPVIIFNDIKSNRICCIAGYNNCIYILTT